MVFEILWTYPIIFEEKVETLGGPIEKSRVGEKNHKQKDEEENSPWKVMVYTHRCRHTLTINEIFWWI